MDWERGREQIWRGIREREHLIRRGKGWEEDRGKVMGGDRGREVGREGGIRAGRYDRGKKRQIVIVAVGRERRTREGGGGKGR